MNDHSQRTLAICAAILIVSLVFSAVVWVSMAKFNENFLAKNFYDTSPRYAPPHQTVRLNDRQFVVTYGGQVTVYQVDANGKLSRTASTAPQQK